jgi:hypothetical protein
MTDPHTRSSARCLPSVKRMVTKHWVFSDLVVVQVIALGHPARRHIDGQRQLHESADCCGWGPIGIPLKRGRRHTGRLECLPLGQRPGWKKFFSVNARRFILQLSQCHGGVLGDRVI